MGRSRGGYGYLPIRGTIRGRIGIIGIKIPTIRRLCKLHSRTRNGQEKRGEVEGYMAIPY